MMLHDEGSQSAHVALACLAQHPTRGLVHKLMRMTDEAQCEGIGVVELTKKDIVRHMLVTRIVNAYEAYDKAAESGKKENRLKKDISDESIDND